MSQTTFDDETLFKEAAGDIRADVEAALEEARAALPEPEAIWAAEADNTLGVLNGLRAALAAEDAAEHLRDAKKWYTMGERADAFEDDEDLAAAIEEVEELFASLATAREAVGEVTGLLPELRSQLEAAHEEE